MGGGHITRANEHTTQPDPNNPMTEFYLIFQSAMARHRRFALPCCYAAFRPPLGQTIYAEDIKDYCELSSQPKQGWREIFGARSLAVLYENLQLTHSGTPAALVLTEEASRHSYAVQLLPPFAGAGVEIPPIPNTYAAITIQLTPQDLDMADTNPAALGRSLLERTEGKQWQHHPAIDRWLTTALAAAQRSTHREKRGW